MWNTNPPFTHREGTAEIPQTGLHIPLLSELSSPVAKGRRNKINKYKSADEIHHWACCKRTFHPPEHKLGTDPVKNVSI